MRSFRWKQISFDHLDKAEAPISDDGASAANIKQIDEAIQEVERIEEDLFVLEKRLIALKDRKKSILTKYIPRIMKTLGTTLIRTPRGIRVTIKKHIAVKIKDKDRLAVFLETRGDDILMDTSFRIKKLKNQDRNTIKEAIKQHGGVIVRADHGLHHSTQRSYFNRLLTEHPELYDRIATIGDISEYYDTKYLREETG